MILSFKLRFQMVVAIKAILNLKRLKFIEFVLSERYTEIERENRILLEKMTNILQNPKGISHANAHLSTMNPAAATSAAVP